MSTGWIWRHMAGWLLAWPPRYVGLLIASVTLLAGCDADDRPFATSCVSGTENCACLAGDVCSGDELFCAGGTCRMPRCTVGDRDCACYANFTCNADDDAPLVCDEGLCREGTCAQGSLGCGCLPNSACDEGLVCASDDGGPLRCVAFDCEVGAEGCACSEQGACSAETKDGEALVCIDGLCLPPTCTLGELDCGCKADRSCNSGLVCGDGGVCVVADCTPGDLGCPCTPRGECNSAALVCSFDNYCVNAGECEQGDLGCGCRADKTCADDTLVCSADDVCIDADCPPGDEGCACMPDEACGRAEDETPLTCVAAVCRNCRAEDCGTPGLTVPVAAACFTPCRDGFTDETGEYHHCDADGLMRHEDDEPCLDKKLCHLGSCVAADAEVPSCRGDVDCPDFQNCVEGRCYSVCDTDADCPSRLECYRHACREPCTSADQGCPDHTACTLTDAESGYCMPVGTAPAGPAEGPVLGTFELSSENVSFDSANTAGSFTITNNGPVAAEFSVTKLEHVKAGDDEIETERPLTWLKMGERGSETLENPVWVSVEPGASLEFRFLDAATDATRWRGAVEVKSENVRLGARRLSLEYVGNVDGRWVGKMTTFGNFGTRNLAAWMADRTNRQKLDVVGNALVARWGVFRGGNISRENFDAALQSAIDESWAWPSVKRDCPRTAACYPFVDPENPSAEGSLGLDIFTSDAAGTPVPTGAAELPVAFDLRATSARVLEGRIVTAEALQYIQDPYVKLTLQSDPTATTCATVNTGECLVFVDSIESTINVGGRYAIPRFGTADACPEHFQPKNTPWLVPGFLAGTTTDSLGVFHKSECREATQPGLADPDVNVALAGGNPVPDGKTRSRELSLVDGVMVDQQTLYLLVREHFVSFLSGSDNSEFAAYGIMRLKRTPTELDATSFAGNVPAPVESPPAEAGLSVGCDDELLAKIGAPDGLSAANASSVAAALLDGNVVDRELTEDLGLEPWQVHYLCHDTGLIDGGDIDLNAGANAECPAGSHVTYFYLTDVEGLSDEDLALEFSHLPCQDNGTCQSTLDAWHVTGKWGIASKAPIYRCRGFETDPDRVFCDENRGDLRADKVFFATEGATGDRAAFSPLRTAISDAFRYKTQFRTRENRSVGFAPLACIPNSDAVPYCYDAAQIEETRARVDCALHIYHEYPDLRTTRGLAALAEFFPVNFAFEQDVNPPAYAYDGFETMYAELLVMLGDDSYTAAFMSRFDLAQSTRLSFNGAAFEPAGIDLSGAAGFEMYRLYQAMQYYSLVLDRFYGLVPSLTQPDGSYEAFITTDTFGSYFPKLVRASTQKTRVASEIAKRYQNFNRPDLARGVIQRAYTAAYLESVVIGSMITRYVDLNRTESAFVEKVRRDAALTYKAALHEMRDAYQRITDDVRYFGFTPDFVPFPALDAADVNAFTKLLAFARQRAGIASQNEQIALASNRSYEVDAASFQAELVKLRINYNNQLADVCGTLRDENGAVYPAIPRYAYLDPEAATLGDPCGLLRTGRLYEAIAGLEINQLELKEINQQYVTLFQDIEIERSRVEQQCGLAADLAFAKYKVGQRTLSVQEAIDNAKKTQLGLDWQGQKLNKLFESMKCVVGLASDCSGAQIGNRLWAIGATALQASEVALQDYMDDREREIAGIQAAHVLWTDLQGCNAAKIDSEALIKQKLLSLTTLDLNALKADYRLRLAASSIRELHDQATRIAAEAEEIEQQTINIEAARNDPNVRIYKNDSIINAERTFDSAMAAAYQATKVYEYFTSQSYGRLDQLFLIRMVAHGDYNLDNYLLQLEDAYLGFQQTFGNPDDRVDIVSLRDDIFAIPRLDEAGNAIPQSKRIERFREKLTDVTLLDERGYLRVPFATSLERLSPLTRNHKLKRVEVEIVGSDVGDAVGRVYLRQAGTGVVQAVNDEPRFYRLPERTAIVDTFFNGARVFGPEIYQSDRLRDRPYVNSRWDLVLNQQDEAANRDIDLSSLTDVRVYLYYTDFTGI